MDQAYPWEEIIIWKCVCLKSCTTTSRFYGISWQHGKTQHIHTRNTTEAIFTKKFCCKLSEWIPFTLPACEVSLLCCASKSDQKKPQRGLSLVLARHNLRYYPLVRFEFMYYTLAECIIDISAALALTATHICNSSQQDEKQTENHCLEEWHTVATHTYPNRSIQLNSHYNQYLEAGILCMIHHHLK